MSLYLLSPEVAGGHGEHTVYGNEKSIGAEGISGKVQFYIMNSMDGLAMIC